VKGYISTGKNLLHEEMETMADAFVKYLEYKSIING